MVYYLSDTGFLIALDAKTGAERWSLNIREKYEGEIARYAYSESPLVDGNRLYVAAYGKNAGVLCLDKKTGRVIWESERLPGTAGDAGDTYPGYASFILVNNSGFRQLIAYTADYLYGMHSEDGKILWTVPFTNKRRDNCTDVVYHDGHVFASSGYGRGSILVRLSAKNGKVNAEKVYDITLMDNHHGGVIFHEGYVYGSGHESKGWFCLDFKTGRQMWNHAPGKGSLTFADGMLYLYDEKGTMSLVKATPKAFTPVSTFEVPAGGMKSHFWAHPVVSNGVLYVRYADNLYAYDVKRW
jgi:outer membrane protein assembly factor BamB